MTYSYFLPETKSSKALQRIVAIAVVFLFAVSANAQTILTGLTSNGGPAGKGTAFSISTTGTGFSVIKGFADWGTNPNGSLIKGSDGNFYGMTYHGGTYNYGTIFTMTPAGQVTILKQFDYTNDGGYPYGELTIGADGNFYGMTSSGGSSSYGTIFKLTSSGVFTIMKNFNYTDGASPHGHLVLATDGNFYGITYSGGSNSGGVIFKMTTAGVYSVLHNMNDATEGSHSYSSLVQGNDGNLYGTAYNGGTNGYGTIFKVTTAGALTVLRHLAAATDGSYPRSTLLQATDGNFYGTCYDGGTNSDGTVFKVTSAGVFTVLKSLSYSTTGSSPYAGVMQNSDGLLYGVTTSGGTKSGGTIYSITTINGTLKVIHSLDYTAEGNTSGSILAKGNDGNLYAMANAGGAYSYGTTFKITTAGTLTVLDNFNGASEGNAPYASFIKGSDSAYYATTSGGGANNYGSIVKICGGVTSVLYSFNSTSGRYPKSRLLLANDGNFYGTTSDGGTNGYGTIFKITPAGVFSIVHNLSYSADGGNPMAGLLQGTDGFLYGTTSSGGANSCGTIFKLSLTGTFTVLRNFVSATDGSNPKGDLLQASDGNLYGMTSSNAHLFKITTSGVFTVLHAFNTSGDGTSPLAGLIQATDGNLYGTCSDGGANAAGIIFQMSLTGTYKVIHSLNSSAEGRMPKGNLLQGADGFLYGTTSIGGMYNAGTIFKVSTTGAYTVLRHMNMITDGGNACGSLIFAPVNNLVANAQAVSTNEDTKIKVVLAGSGGSPLTYAIVTAPAHGKLTGAGANQTYTPAKDYNGNDQFSFAVSVGCMTSAPAIVSLTIKPVADTPVLEPIGNKTAVVNTKLTFKAIATDGDNGQTLSYSLVGAPTGATINATTGVFNWTPTVAGTYTFKVRVTDNGIPPLYDEEQITVTVTNTLNTFLATDVKENNTITVNVFPNPADAVLNVLLPNSVNHLSVTITDLQGAVLSKKECNTLSSNQISLQVSGLSRGIYLLHIHADELDQTSKFIKK